MESFLTQLYSQSDLPVLSALILGLMTAISPCPLAANITAIGYISREIENRKKVFINGLLYTFGRIISYTLLAFILFTGAEKLNLSGLFQEYGEKFLGPLLILTGLFMLGILNLNLGLSDRMNTLISDKRKFSGISAVFMGIILALAFCPYSGVLYFGMLIPLTLASDAGLMLPVVFATATGLPVILFAWILAFAVSEIGRFYNNIKKFEFWFRKVVAIVFLAIGIYYTWSTLIKNLISSGV